jgi:hypothetical protein
LNATGAGLVERAKHECDGVIGDGRFDLRQPLTKTALLDELRELAEQAVHGRHQHGAMQHVRDVRPRALSKPDEHAVFAGDILHAEPRAPAVVPRGANCGRQPLERLDVANALQCFRDGLLLERHLRRMRQMLQRAAAAAAEVLAFGLHPRRRGLDDAEQVGLLHLAAPLAQCHFDALAW